jgi:hypothetical protein
MTTTVNHDMIEEIAANLGYWVEHTTSALAEAQNVDPDDLVTEMIGAPNSARQLAEALTQLAALGQEAAELLEMLP